MTESRENGQFECLKHWKYTPKNVQENCICQQQQASECWPGGLRCRRVRAVVSNGSLWRQFSSPCVGLLPFLTPWENACLRWKSEPNWLYFLGPDCTAALLFYPARSFSAPAQESHQLTAVTDSSDRADVRSELSCFSAAGLSSFKTRIGEQSQTAYLSCWNKQHPKDG